MSEDFNEEKYSYKAAHAGEDIGKPGKNFAKIAKSAGEKYGSAERGKKVAGAILAKIRAKHMKEDSGKGETYDTTSHSPTDAKLVKDKKQTSIVKPVKTHEESIAEAKAPSPIAGTRLISRHVGSEGHHAEVRYNPEWQEHSVHHYHDGKHLGEGPVSYHGDGREGREDATNTAKYATNIYHVKGGKLVKVNEEDEGWYTHAQMYGSKKSEKHPEGISAAEWKSGVRWDHRNNKRINVKEDKDQMNQSNKYSSMNDQSDMMDTSL